MTQKDLDCLKKYLDIKVVHCNISETQSQDIYDMMRIDRLEEPINEEELDRLAIKAEKVTFLDTELPFQTKWVEGFKAGYRKALNK